VHSCEPPSPHHYPRLKSGLHLIPLNSDEFYIGSEEEGIYIPLDPYLPIARACNGTFAIHEIASLTSTPPGIVASFAQELISYNYLELLTSPIDSSSLNQSWIQFDQRISPELSVITWRPHVSDGGFKEISDRTDFSILIFGQTRLARTLLAILQSMGFTRCRIIEPQLNTRQTVTAHDVCGVVTRAQDIGRRHSELHREITRLSLLAHTDGQLPASPRLLISTTTATADYVQRWMSEGIPYLHIAQPRAHTLEIGPLVLSGESACIHCVQLHKRDQLPPFITLASGAASFSATQPELPTASVAFIAGAIATAVSEFASTGQSDLINHSYLIDLLHPLESTSVRHLFWNIHPECGCNATWASDSTFGSNHSTIIE
jgi:hypothetical protein